MRVFNVSSEVHYYHGKPIPPNGGSVELVDLGFIPTRDLKLQEAKILAFGSLPQWFLDKQAAEAAQSVEVVKEEQPQIALKELVVVADGVAVAIKVPDKKKDQKS